MCAFWSQICRIQIECEIEYTIEETPSKCPKYLGKMNMRTNSKTVLEGSSPSAPFMSSRTLYRSRRLFFCKAIGSFTPPPLLSTKSHAGCGCSLAGALTPPSRRTGSSLHQIFSSHLFRKLFSRWSKRNIACSVF